MALGRPRSRVGLSSPQTPPQLWQGFLGIRLCLRMSMLFARLILIVNSTQIFSYFLTTMPCIAIIFSHILHRRRGHSASQLSWMVHQDEVVSAQMKDRMVEISSMPQKNLPHSLAPLDRTRLPHALFEGQLLFQNCKWYCGECGVWFRVRTIC